MSIKDASKYLSLSDALTNLKLELAKAHQRALADGDAMLEFRECEIELSLEFEPKAEVEVDAVLFKVKAGAGAKGGHKIKVKYGPLGQIVAAATDASVVAPAALGPAGSVAARLQKPAATAKRRARG